MDVAFSFRHGRKDCPPSAQAGENEAAHNGEEGYAEQKGSKGELESAASSTVFGWLFVAHASVKTL